MIVNIVMRDEHDSCVTVAPSALAHAVFTECGSTDYVMVHGEPPLSGVYEWQDFARDIRVTVDDRTWRERHPGGFR